MKNICLAFAALLCMVACSKKITGKTAEIAPKAAAPAVLEVSPEVKPKMEKAAQTATKAVGIPKDIDQNLMASLRRSPCFGRCPAFSYDLFADGKVAYYGQSNVSRMGSYTAKADASFMKQVADKAMSIKYLSLADHYPTADMAVSDVPTTTTYIRVGNDGKKITNNYDPPRDLTEFEQWLEAQFETLTWIQTKE
jgi:Domain of unknown function (DUF6438)